MAVFCYTLTPQSPWRTPLRSDTLHGLLLCAMAEWEGEKAVQEVCQEFINGKVPFACSSAFPAHFLPKPCLPPIARSAFQEKYPHNLLDMLNKYKSFAKSAFIPSSLFFEQMDTLSQLSLFQHYVDNKGKWKCKASETHAEPHNTINRNSNTVLGGGLFFPEAVFHEPQIQYHIYATWEKPEKMVSYLEHIGKYGFGADSALGKGRFVVEPNPQDVTKHFEGKGKHHLTLGVLAGENMSTLDGYYKTFTKKGRAWAAKSGVSPFKKPFLALNEGAVLKTLPQNCTLQGLHQDKTLLQLCHTLTLPCAIAGAS